MMRRGACVRCCQQKRKCDQKQPACSQCSKKGVKCELQRFKMWDARSLPSRGTGRAKSPPPGSASKTSATHQRSSSWTTNSALGRLTSTSETPGSLNSFLLGCDTLVDQQTCEDGQDSERASASWDSDANSVNFWTDLDKIWQEYKEVLMDPLATELNFQSTPLLDDSQGLLPPVIDNSMEQHEWSSEISFAPDPLLTPPNMRVKETYLWHHFITVTIVDLTIFELDAFPQRCAAERGNPFHRYIPNLAWAHICVYNAALALAGMHHDKVKGCNEFQPFCRSLMAEILHSSSPGLSCSGTDFEDLSARLCALLLLCLCHYFSEDTERWHQNIIASRLLVTSLKDHPRRRPDHNGLLSFLFTLQAFVEIASQLSLGVFQPCLQDFISTVQVSNEYLLTGSDQFEEETRQSMSTLLAFSPRLLCPLLAIGRHIQQLKVLKRSVLIATMEDSHTDSVGSHRLVRNRRVDGSENRVLEDTQVAELEEQLLQADLEDRRDSLVLHYACLEFRLITEAMHAAAFLLLYGRLKGLPPTAMLMRQKVKQILDISRRASKASKAFVALLLPLVVAGCECVELADRDYVYDVLSTLQRCSWYDIGRIRQMLQLVWQLRDNDPGLGSLEWQQIGRSIPRPMSLCLGCCEGTVFDAKLYNDID